MQLSARQIAGPRGLADWAQMPYPSNRARWLERETGKIQCWQKKLSFKLCMYRTRFMCSHEIDAVYKHLYLWR